MKNRPSWHSASEADWEEACRREAVIRPLVVEGSVSTLGFAVGGTGSSRRAGAGRSETPLMRKIIRKIILKISRKISGCHTPHSRHFSGDFYRLWGRKK